MAVVCARCQRFISGVVYFCRKCRVHYGWDCTNSGKCRKCGSEVLRMD